MFLCHPPPENHRQRDSGDGDAPAVLVFAALLLGMGRPKLPEALQISELGFAIDFPADTKTTKANGRVLWRATFLPR